MRQAVARLGLCVAAGMAGSARTAPRPAVMLPNPGFEQTGEGRVDGYAKKGFVGQESQALRRLPDGWHAYQWGSPADSRYSVAVESGTGRNGAASARFENLDASAKAGLYTHVKLEAGSYELSVWARTPDSQTGKLAMYLGTAYSAPLKVTDQWRRLTFRNTLSKPIERTEINIQNATGRPGVIWVDDVSLHPVAPVSYTLAPDTRTTRPRTLLFSPINVNYLRDTAEWWAETGFRGFLFDAVMHSWPTDVWAVDGDTATRGEGDALLGEVRACNDACRRHGIDSNFVKVAFYEELPDWFDDSAWMTIAANFRQGARFARMSGCVGLAVDTEYIAKQYAPDWEGYAELSEQRRTALKDQVRRRLRTVTASMLEEYPDMVLLTLPEGMLYYGELYTGIFLGMLQACAEARAPGGLHVMTEGTYHMTALETLEDYPERIDSFVRDEAPKPLADYWRRTCSVAMGVWPLGYYRAINDADGTFKGWSGKEALFGDKIIGSYGDKSEWYSPEEFARQVTGVNTFCPRYNWVYGHGCVFWQCTEDQLAKYRPCAHKARSNVTLPTVPNLGDYIRAIAKPMLAVRDKPKEP